MSCSATPRLIRELGRASPAKVDRFSIFAMLSPATSGPLNAMRLETDKGRSNQREPWVGIQLFHGIPQIHLAHCSDVLAEMASQQSTLELVVGPPFVEDLKQANMRQFSKLGFEIHSDALVALRADMHRAITSLRRDAAPNGRSFRTGGRIPLSKNWNFGDYRPVFAVGYFTRRGNLNMMITQMKAAYARGMPNVHVVGLGIQDLSAADGQSVVAQIPNMEFPFESGASVAEESRADTEP
ncbi:uncharacterized protein L3040_008161 [Drepanopeziza brunnea f. sp. 'multigermtubi']|uniref:Uncharacterized protein n=1 Tax=Marssonina brunnea f. sp. multigermtubi (strain MB_m1) TaxID=1072389 RepID=K1XJ87_MARBU|nr:uncharacterized protein MBM_09380 [Drepanopeziza brunnea f. sp. 'multigermtubi' MB_m1]EKD12514.1 hypothetical protein MBM_09380 [Drepanopeziza brunnea f. sp. 'multigermtubi' MB_m1]KAJ5034893.1 hypothetical protein L3040_008161 [Drepanopeziza brunnea f. sp. 'multigermtubi']